MADNSKIQWTGATWNVVTGCTRVSEGCRNCYITGTPPFRMAGRKFDHDGMGASTGVLLHPDRLEWPLHWRKPRMVFVNSLADLFHDDVPDRLIGEVFNVMGAAKQHTFQLLTKRPGRMRSLLRRWSKHAEGRGCYCPENGEGCSAPVDVEHGVWPLSNVWVGVSAEDQWWADKRIPVLLETPAAVRWVSAEPLLNPLSLHPGKWIPPRGGGPRVNLEQPWQDSGPSLDWVVVGGESGANARRMAPGWLRHVVDECQESGTPVFVKQFGSVWASDFSVGGKSVAACGDRKGGDWRYWPADLRVREFPTAREEVSAR